MVVTWACWLRTLSEGIPALAHLPLGDELWAKPPGPNFLSAWVVGFTQNVFPFRKYTAKFVDSYLCTILGPTCRKPPITGFSAFLTGTSKMGPTGGRKIRRSDGKPSAIRFVVVLTSRSAWPASFRFISLKDGTCRWPSGQLYFGEALSEVDGSSGTEGIVGIFRCLFPGKGHKASKHV